MSSLRNVTVNRAIFTDGIFEKFCCQQNSCPFATAKCAFYTNLIECLNDEERNLFHENHFSCNFEAIMNVFSEPDWYSTSYKDKLLKIILYSRIKRKQIHSELLFKDFIPCYIVVTLNITSTFINAIRVRFSFTIEFSLPWFDFNALFCIFEFVCGV